MEFRVWNVYATTYEDHNNFALTSRGYLVWYTFNKYVPDSVPEIQDIDQDQYIVEKCTGFVDQRGKDVYIGDVLENGITGSLWVVSIDSKTKQPKITHLNTNFETALVSEVCEKEYKVVDNIHDYYKKKDEEAGKNQTRSSVYVKVGGPFADCRGCCFFDSLCTTWSNCKLPKDRTCKLDNRGFPQWHYEKHVVNNGFVED